MKWKIGDIVRCKLHGGGWDSECCLGHHGPATDIRIKECGGHIVLASDSHNPNWILTNPCFGSDWYQGWWMWSENLELWSPLPPGVQESQHTVRQ